MNNQTQREPMLAPEIGSSRAHETRVTIGAPLEEVWKTITEPDRLARWFAPAVNVQPGVGGHMSALWTDCPEWRTAIEVWEPNRHLRLVENRTQVYGGGPTEQPLPPATLIQDYFLETENGKTVLRLVHSGFGWGGSWDGEFEGTRGGWPICFLRLKTTLENHPNEPVHNFHHGFLAAGATNANEILDRLESASQPFTPAVKLGSERAGFIGGANGSIFNYCAQSTPDGVMVFAGLLVYGSADDEARAMEQDFFDRIQSVIEGRAAHSASSSGSR